MLLPRFAPFSFYARFTTVIGQTDACGLENGKKGTRERAVTQAREGQVWNVLYTARNVQWLSFVPRACGTCLTVLFGSGILFARRGMKGVGCAHVMFYMYNASHSRFSCQLLSKRSLAACNSRVTCTQGRCCGSWPVVRLFVKRLMQGRGHVGKVVVYHGCNE